MTPPGAPVTGPHPRAERRTDAQDPDGRAAGGRWPLVLVLSLASFTTLLDLTITNIALPSLLTDLHASFEAGLWTVNSYALVLTVLLLTGGRLGDLYGPRILMLAGTAVFTLASLACGLAATPTALIVGRCAQGAGAALLLPQPLAIIQAVFPAGRRGLPLGVWSAVAGLAMIVGPTLGGLLVTGWGWRWTFLVNVPAGVAVLAAAPALVPRPSRRAVGRGAGRGAAGLAGRERLDLLGVVLGSAALGGAVFAVTEAPRHGWDAVTATAASAAAVLLAALLVQQRSRQDGGGRGVQPLLPFALFTDRDYTLLTLVRAAIAVGLIGLFLPMTLYLQSIRNFSALTTGLVMAPAALGALAMVPLTGWLTDIVGAKRILCAGLLLFATGMVLIVARTGTGTAPAALIPVFTVTGLGAGCLFAPSAAAALHNVPPRLAGAASGVMATACQLGSAAGGVAVGALLQARLAAALAHETSPEHLPLTARLARAARDGTLDLGRHGAATGNPHDAATANPHGAATAVVAHDFVTALHQTLLLPIAVVLLAAFACPFLRHRSRPSPHHP